ncbi:MAG TPA: IS200/IS605 family transposase [Bacteroidales bacterium]
MPHSFTNIWIHAIWATKGRYPFIENKIEGQIYKFIEHQFEEMNCQVKIINGIPDHVHCLFLLNAQKSIAEVLKQVKGSSSFFINEQNLTEGQFSWQTGYSAFSVSESMLDKVFQYIKNQKAHHQLKTFQEENEEYLKLFGFNKKK